MEQDFRQRVWRLYGWFSGLMLCGSCFGAVAWAAWMRRIVLNFQANVFADYSVDQSSLLALSLPWLAVFAVSYATEFLFLSASQLMVLDRMSDFLKLQADSAPRLFFIGARVVMAVVVAANAAGLASSIAAAQLWLRAAASFSDAATIFSANQSSSAGRLSFSQGIALNRSAYSTASVQSFCEVCVLLLIFLAFAVVGVACHRRIGAMLLGAEAAAQAAASGRQLQLQILGTSAFVFLSFLVRSVFATLFAVANALQDSENPCPSTELGLCDPACYNVYTRISRWISRTPEFQLSVELLSAPLALLVALWGMTSPITLQLMRKQRDESSLLGGSSHSPRAIASLHAGGSSSSSSRNNDNINNPTASSASYFRQK
jgi:hypothetical protein